jgi:hypothetical protein
MSTSDDPSETRRANRPVPVAPSASGRADLDAFLKQAATLRPVTSAGERGRLAFALDATMSRQPTWDAACALQGDMFKEAERVGGLDIQLVYFRGLGECRASPWVSSGRRLADLMSRIDCRGGHTQIGRVLRHVATESRGRHVQALVFVGDAMEEAIDDVSAAAGELALRGVPAFVFQEGGDAVAERAFREIARITKGAYARFEAGAAAELADLLRAVAVYAAGGRRALSERALASPTAGRLIGQMR